MSKDRSFSHGNGNKPKAKRSVSISFSGSGLVVISLESRGFESASRRVLKREEASARAVEVNRAKFNFRLEDLQQFSDDKHVAKGKPALEDGSS